VNPTAATRVIALLGDPVSHSFSPALHNAAMQALHLDGVYVALRCSSADCSPLLHALARAGGAGNVTIPHKQIAAQAVDVRTTAVERTGACNTFWLEDGRVHGDNTDVEGFRRTVQDFLGNTAGARVLLLGGGGAARAIVVALADARVAAIDVVTRRAAQFDELKALVHDPTPTLRDVTGVRDRYDFIVHATPLGLHPDDPMPVDPEHLHGTPAVIDLVYRAGGTAWVHGARAAGVRAIDGLEMLIHQAAGSFERWWHRPAPIEPMRAAIRPPNLPPA
jgi:shikimate dehydrogenase